MSPATRMVAGGDPSGGGESGAVGRCGVLESLVAGWAFAAAPLGEPSVATPVGAEAAQPTRTSKVNVSKAVERSSALAHRVGSAISSLYIGTVSAVTRSPR